MMETLLELLEEMDRDGGTPARAATHPKELRARPLPPRRFDHPRLASLGRRESELRFSVEVRQSEVSPVRLARHGSSAERSIEKALDRLRLTLKLNGEALGGVPHY